MSFKTMFKILLQNSILFTQENLCDGCNSALDLLVNGEITTSSGGWLVSTFHTGLTNLTNV